MSAHQHSAGILVAVDESPAAMEAARWAAAEARLHGSRLTLVHVLTPVVIDTQDVPLRKRLHSWRRHCAKRLLRDAERELAGDGVLGRGDIATELLFGGPVAELTELSQSAAMLVVGSRFHGSAGGRRLGSVSAALSYRVACPLAVVHHYDESISSKPVLVGIDGSPASERAMAIAFDEASRRGVGLIAAHVWSDVGVIPLLGMDWHAYEDQAGEVLAERLAGWQERYPDVVVERSVFCDVPAHHLQREAERASLVVVGSHGRGATAALTLGSVATAVAEGVDAPVIIARSR